MNDPNGLVYYENEYHLFFQYNPNDIVWGPMHWGHAISKDLITWEHLPIALYPDELGTIYSGSCVVDWKDTSGFFAGKSGLVAMFTHHTDEAEVQSIAYSKDHGRTWNKYQDNPVIPNPGVKDFRDPKLFWHEETKQWKAIFAYKDRVRIYGSHNLKTWSFLSEFGEFDGSHDGVWECPELFWLPVDGNENQKKWVLKVDIGNAVAGGSGGQYYIGEFDGIQFINDNSPDTVLWLDYGKDFYASQSFSETYETQKRRVWLAWMNNWQYANKIPAKHQRGVMSFPRTVRLKKTAAGIRLVQEPVEELTTIQNLLFSYNNKEYLDTEYVFSKDIAGVKIMMCFQMEESEEGLIKLYFNPTEYIYIKYIQNENILLIDRTNAGKTDFHEAFPAVFQVPVEPMLKKIELQILVDATTIEVFVNEGTTVCSSLIFPSHTVSKLSWKIPNKIDSLNIFELCSKNE